MARVALVTIVLVGAAFSALADDLVNRPYLLDSELVSRSISFENRSGAPGQGGKAASPLGVGRKGAPARMVKPGELLQLADVEGPGTIRHIWMTTLSNPVLLRGLVLRAYWDGQKHASIEVPLGDFFGFAHGTTEPFQSAAHSVGERLGMNIWLPMPFPQRARLTLTNDSELAVPFFYQIDYTLADRHEDSVGRLHVVFRRQNPTERGVDFELLPKRSGAGRYMGSVIGVRPLSPEWWGEGEVKIFLDSDQEFATIVGTGAEDFVGLSWGLQRNAFQYHGASRREKPDFTDTGFVSMYRWFMRDPIYWKEDIRVTIQQIGHLGDPDSIDEYLQRLFERQDDWSAASFWYERIPSAPLPPFPSVAARTANLPTRTQP